MKAKPQTVLNDFIAKKGISKSTLMYHIIARGIQPCGSITSKKSKRPSYLWYVEDLERAASRVNKRVKHE